MGRAQVCLTGGCARSGKVKPRRGGPGVASSPPAPEDGDARGGHRAAERRPGNAHAICQQEPASRQPRPGKMRGRPGDARERRACLTAGCGPEPLHRRSASGASSRRDPGAGVAPRTCSAGSSPRRRRPRGPQQVIPRPVAPVVPNLPALRRPSGCGVHAHRRPLTPASAPEARPCSPELPPLPHVLAPEGGTQRH